MQSAADYGPIAAKPSGEIMMGHLETEFQRMRRESQTPNGAQLGMCCAAC